MDKEERLKIRKRVRDAFRHRKYQRPKYCGYCGLKTKIEVHHYRYKPEDYVWICRTCHSNIHQGFNYDGNGCWISHKQK